MVDAPIRGVEFGPWLGVVASPRPRVAPGMVPLDAARMVLLGQVLAEAHRPAPDWLGPWGELTATVATEVLGALRHRATVAAAASLAPDQVARQAFPGEDEIRMVRAQLASTGIPLERAVATLPAGAGSERTFAVIGGALEESWLALERTVGTVVGEWGPRIARVAAWRRPTAPLWVGTGAVLIAATLLGVLIGGYLRGPTWFQPMTDWWWSLPWP